MTGEKLKTYRDLRVWQESKDLAKAVYAGTDQLPPSERYGLCSQMRRAAVSVPANIAEGYGRQNRGEYVQFLGIANGSLRELETYIIIASEMNLLAEGHELLHICDSVGRKLSALRSSLRPDRTR